MYIEELAIIVVIIAGIVMYRNYQGQNVGKYIINLHLIHCKLLEKKQKN